jgi:hypothetical protein
MVPRQHNQTQAIGNVRMLKKFLVRAKVLFQKEVGRFQALLL